MVGAGSTDGGGGGGGWGSTGGGCKALTRVYTAVLKIYWSNK